MLKILDPSWTKVGSALVGMIIGLAVIILSFVAIPLIFGGKATLWNSYGPLTICTAILVTHTFRKKLMESKLGFFQTALLIATGLCLFMWTLATAIFLDIK